MFVNRYLRNVLNLSDLYVGSLEQGTWSNAQAETQFQGKGLSHEHASLLLTEAINITVTSTKLPVFCLYLDAMSAYDRALREILTRRLYLDGTSGHPLVFLDERLKNRVTYIEWDKTIMGPIRDQQGFEQGGTNSSDGSSYHYSNNNGSYYYANDNGSTYYQPPPSSSAPPVYTPPPSK